MFDFKAKLVRADWATNGYLTWGNNLEHLSLLREFMAYNVLCPKSCPIFIDVNSGMVKAGLGYSVHWSRTFEWPWCVMHGCSFEGAGDVRVLDAGGGYSLFQYALLRRFREVVNVDENDESLAVAEIVAASMGRRNLTTRKGDIKQIPYPDGHFGVSFCVSVLEHIHPGWEQAVNELFRVTSPGGAVLITLDVTHKRTDGRVPDGDELFVADVNRLVNAGGGELPDDKWIMTKLLEDGDTLSCLCLKFVKEL